MTCRYRKNHKPYGKLILAGQSVCCWLTTRRRVAGWQQPVRTESKTHPHRRRTAASTFRYLLQCNHKWLENYKTAD